jgi:cell wall-associated NlpC family hydrolase
MNGIEIPRDCYLQFPVGKPVEPPFQPGDLLYFWNEAKTKMGHVGISTGGWNIIHSSRSRNGVYEEDVQQNEGLKASFAGARSFLIGLTLTSPRQPRFDGQLS